MYIALLAHRTWVKYREEACKSLKTYAMYCIHPSLPKEVLKDFGGNMTIEEYRKGFFGIIPPSEAKVGKPFVTFRQTLLLPFVKQDGNSGGETSNPTKPVTQKIDTSMVHRYSNAFCEKLNKAKSGNNPNTIMKRKRESSSKNTLMSTMGVKIETKKRS